jgi:hypothetical protein
MFFSYLINLKIQPSIGAVPLAGHGNYVTYGFADGQFGSHHTKPLFNTPWGDPDSAAIKRLIKPLRKCVRT